MDHYYTCHYLESCLFQTGWKNLRQCCRTSACATPSFRGQTKLYYSFIYYFNLIAIHTSTAVSPSFILSYQEINLLSSEINPGCLGWELQRWIWSPGEVIWLSCSPSVWTTMTVLTQSFPTRKHCQRAALLHHTPTDLRVRLLGLCTKVGSCVLLPWQVTWWLRWVRWRGQVVQEFTLQLCSQVSNIWGVKQAASQSEDTGVFSMSKLLYNSQFICHRNMCILGDL